MATPISIVISAINKSKAAFNEVVDQLDKTKNRIDKFSNAFRGLFVAGMFAGFVKGLVDATTETEKLQGAVAKIKDGFRPVAQTIADGLVSILDAMAKPIAAVGQFINKIIEGVQYASAYTAALIETKSHSEAKAIAETTVAQLASEREARAAAQQTAKEKEQLAKEVADAQIKEAERVAKERERLENEISKLETDLSESRKKREESAMSDEELLYRRRKESVKAYEDYRKARGEGNRKAELEALAEFERLNDEILTLENKIAEAAKKTADEKAKQAESAAKQKEAEELRLQAKNDEEKILQRINQLEKQREELLKKQAELIDESATKRKLAIDKNARKEAREAEKQANREERRFNQLLENARRKMRENERGGLQRGLSEAERLALESEQARIGAGVAGREAEETQKTIENLQEKMTKHLESIDEKIKEAIAFTR